MGRRQRRVVAAVARMISRMSPAWCPHCAGPPGPDCPDKGREKKSQRAREKREARREAEEEMDEDEQSVCRQVHKGHLCTRDSGHSGHHLAKTPVGTFSWNQTISASGRWKGVRT